MLEKDAKDQYPNFKLPWRVKIEMKGIVRDQADIPPPASKVTQATYRAIGTSLRTMGKILGIDCKPCHLRDRIMAKIGVLGVGRANELLIRSLRIKEGTPEFDELQRELSVLLDGERSN